MRTRRTVRVPGLRVQEVGMRRKLVRVHMDSYEGRKLKERRREYDVTYYKGPGLTSTTRRAAGQRNEEGIERWGPGGRMTVLEVDEGAKSFKTMFA